jgi:hypothetical protein
MTTLREAGQSQGLVLFGRPRAVLAADSKRRTGRSTRISGPTTRQARRDSTASSISRKASSRVEARRWPSAVPDHNGVFVVMEVAARDADVVGYESILQDGKAVGYVTSVRIGHCVRRAWRRAYVPRAWLAMANDFEIDIPRWKTVRPPRCDLQAVVRSRRGAGYRG